MAPLIVTEAEIGDIVERLDRAIARAVATHSPDIEYSDSSSLAANDARRRIS